MIATSQVSYNKINQEPSVDSVKIDGVTFFKIAHIDELPPFFMSIVSSGNHWIFLGSNGSISAGRKDAESALFPYYTVDKIIESAEITGSKSIFRVGREGEYLWEPFSIRNNKEYKVTRNLYKSIYGNSVIFEEVNHDLKLIYSYRWSNSEKYGFVRTSTLENISTNKTWVEVLDGIQNVIPQGVGSELQNRASNLVDAYKRNELDSASGVAMYALSAMIVDKAEPREALKANVAWSLGLENPQILLSSQQLTHFRKRRTLKTEKDVKGEKGAYFLHSCLELVASEKKTWRIIANVNQSQSQVIELIQQVIQNPLLPDELNEDILDGTKRLIKLNASADALQKTTDPLNDARHFSNVLFNVMRGGIFDNNYVIRKNDFMSFLAGANPSVFDAQKSVLDAMPDTFELDDLKSLVQEKSDADFKRLATEYLPLRFSRRHGDPSRPWNKFSINTTSEVDGSDILDYEGNWRDIFQNWEALVHAFPEFIDGMIFKFLNATTFDGYNPYRVTKDGFDWETIEPDDPWSYIGYWGDHQIIYLLKFLEIIEDRKPGSLESWFDQELFVYANVPYRIKSYEAIIANPKDTIDFDHEADESIRALREKEGGDGALLKDEKGRIYHVNFVEKTLATLLAKLSNFIPEGGIWMNTQRPEWNDANNALVGNGVSMVTLYYLHRFLTFFDQILNRTSVESVKISSELMDFYKGVRKILLDHEYLLASSIDDSHRGKILDALGEIASDYRLHIYEQGFWGKKRSISIKGLQNFTRVALQFIQHSIAANRREDGMYHAYNLMTRTKGGVSIAYLDEMLEGQAAVLSAKYLSPRKSLEVLDALKASALFREDQYSYILYPNKDLSGFLSKNVLPNDRVESSKLLQALLAKGDTSIVEKDVRNQYHFNGQFGYGKDLENALDKIEDEDLRALVLRGKDDVLDIFEQVFNHKAFTGRSGTFFGYEGLGSIYWHMVSKLLLATQECCLQAMEQEESDEVIGRLLEHYYEIQAGIGVHKSPKLYGAFPTDPYSHTPAGRGAQQPGMTGQVKEDILAHWGELGVYMKDGLLHFNPSLLREEEFLSEPGAFSLVHLDGEMASIPYPENSLVFTYCQVPVIYVKGNESKITVETMSGVNQFDQLHLSKEMTNQLTARSGEIVKIIVHVLESQLR